jgi:hypothetical protein
MKRLFLAALALAAISIASVFALATSSVAKADAPVCYATNYNGLTPRSSVERSQDR